MISMPFRTAIIQSERTSVYMAQVEYAEAGWSFAAISRKDFDKAEFHPNDDVHFHTRACTYVFFDSAYPSDMIEDDYLSFELEEGNYTLSCAYFNPDPSAGVLLYRITRSI